MKKIFFSLMTAASVATMFFLQGCEGPVGPPGPAGADGLIGEVHEVKASFTSSNKYAADFDFKPAILEGDKVVGFIQEGEDNQGNYNWEPLPQTFFYNGNTYLFTYNFSLTGFTIFLDGNASPGLIDSGTRTDRYFRMLIVPAALVGKVDLSNMKDIMAKMGVEESDINIIH
ncbi:hypothetical protein [Leadbetterella sp. DM7]|uniref:hypothetical protein n=1 Tax=Leadbetterella sp. DM7 TaxID=3235085 RepID=UPI00349EA374